ncbi:protein SYM1-like isoform X2 [Vicia villosa]|uniref:protein SYM1-like isoform X2 n=1 Tax=Vicia villosa TaxID=3911 RepID=UPI00273CB583|nr:protein SYM1-like isoform X2 [Vicia villosa]
MAMILKAWNWYQNSLSVHPVKTQVTTSGVLWAVGDITAQYITHTTAAKKQLSLTEADTKFVIDWRRVAVTSMFGIGFVGPVGHFWYEGLDKFINHNLKLIPKTAQSVATKVAMDGLIFGPIHLFVFFTYMGLSAGKTIPEVKEDLKRNYIPALVLEGGVWPIVQIFNFRYVPVKYQLLYVNLFCLLDSAFLSWLEQQKDAPWKQRFQPFQSSNGKGAQ